MIEDIIRSEETMEDDGAEAVIKPLFHHQPELFPISDRLPVQSLAALVIGLYVTAFLFVFPRKSPIQVALRDRLFGGPQGLDPDLIVCTWD